MTSEPDAQRMRSASSYHNLLTVESRCNKGTDDIRSILNPRSPSTVHGNGIPRLNGRLSKWRLDLSVPEATWPPTSTSLEVIMRRFSLVSAHPFTSAYPSSPHMTRLDSQSELGLSSITTPCRHWPMAWIQYMSRCLKASRSASHPERHIGSSSGNPTSKRSRSSQEDTAAGADPGCFTPVASMLFLYLCSNLKYALRLVIQDAEGGEVVPLPDCDAYFLLILVKDFSKEIPTHLPLNAPSDKDSDTSSGVSHKRKHYGLSNVACNLTMSRYDAYMLVLEALDVFSRRCGRYRPIAIKCAALASELVKVQLHNRTQVLEVLLATARSMASSIEGIQHTSCDESLPSKTSSTTAHRFVGSHFLDGRNDSDSLGSVQALLFVPALSSLARSLKEVEAESNMPNFTRTDASTISILIDVIATLSCCLKRLLCNSGELKNINSSRDLRALSAESLLQGLAEDDVALISSLLHLLEVYSRLSSLAASVVLLQNKIDFAKIEDFLSLLRSVKFDPIGSFIWFVRDALCGDVTVLLDLVTSNETDALQYVLRVLKFIDGATSDTLMLRRHLKQQPCILGSFASHNATQTTVYEDSSDEGGDDGPVVPFILSFLRAFTEQLGRMQRADLLPFNAEPLLSAARRAIARLTTLSSLSDK